MRILKFPLDDLSRQAVIMPKGSMVLDIQIQHGVIMLWAACDESNDSEERYIRMCGTGREVRGFFHLTYLTTIQMDDVAIHVFEETAAKQPIVNLNLDPAVISYVPGQELMVKEQQ